MKTIMLMCILLMFCFINTNAQENSGSQDQKRKNTSSREAKHKFVFGVKAGANRSNVYDQQEMLFASPKSGFVGGIFSAIPIGSFLGIQPEVLLSQKGFSGRGTFENEIYSIDRRTTFLDIPLQVQLKPFRFLSVVGGVQYSYLLNQNDVYDFGPNSLIQKESFKNDNVRKNIFGIVAGLDINIRHIVLSGRTGWDMQKNNGDGSSYSPRYKNVWLQGTLGYRFY